MARNLVLVGFMGSGKSVVGRQVAVDLGLPFVDVDEVVMERTGKSIARIFVESGEAAFRERETSALKHVLARGPQVIATGGGALVKDDNWRRVRDGNLVVHLSASPRALLRRIRRDASGAVRPLAGQVKLLLAARLPRYQEAEVTVDTTGRNLASVVREVASLARSRGIGA